MTVLLFCALALWFYAYAGYPLLLLLATSWRPRPAAPVHVGEWPPVTVVVPAYNEAGVIGDTLETILAADYPAHRLHVLVISDASTDGTDDIVRGYASRGVHLLRMPTRGGKTAAENTAAELIEDDLVINTDASVGVHPSAFRHLVAALADSSVGVASARDVSIARAGDSANGGEGAYVGYEMWVRDLETRAGTIVGASGCLYAVRSAVHQYHLPSGLSRDFAAALMARLRGYRSVSVPQAICYVPRSASLKQEYRRKVRTMTRGLATLWYARSLLNPFVYGRFAWMLMSHKLCRWLLPWAAVAVLLACATLAIHSPAAQLAIAAAVLLFAFGVTGWAWRGSRPTPRVFAVVAYAGAGLVAGLHAWVHAFTGRTAPVWEPTRRPPATPA
jgi:cellulose synthase/poly-beta-1,6-N-acetylglucosamine synthase-like glycosyltransferase